MGLGVAVERLEDLVHGAIEVIPPCPGAHDLRAYTERDGGLIDIKTEPLLNSLREDPRYRQFLSKLQMPAG